MKDVYIVVHVHDDGDNELTRVRLDPSEVTQKIYAGDLCFNADKEVDKLTRELLTYGNDPEDVKEAVVHILNSGINTTCIVGKV